MFKPCCICRHPKPLGDFYRDSRASDGHQCRCKKCHNDLDVARKQANPEAYLLSHKRAQRRYVEKHRVVSTVRRFGHRENATLVSRVWSAAALASISTTL
jgi:hypothetical protein